MSIKQNPVKNGHIKSRQILSDDFKEYIKGSSVLNGMDLESPINLEPEWDIEKLTYLKKISERENINDVNKEEKANKKAVKFHLDTKSSIKVMNPKTKIDKDDLKDSSLDKPKSMFLFD